MMAGDINPASIFLPVLAVVALTILAFMRMAAARARGIKERPRDPGYFRAFIGESEPEYTIVAVRHYSNLFELPVLFYAGCISAFVLGDVVPWSLGWAWAYVAARVVQSAVHLSYNNPAHRGMAFVLGIVCITGLWVHVGMAVVQRL
ncbi:MAG: MAPEG family protein [Sphingobium sp.]